MTIESLGQTGRKTILATAARYGARNVRVFGSVARGEADDQSDLDLLVDLDQLSMRVDASTEGMLRKEIRNRILSEALPL